MTMPTATCDTSGVTSSAERARRAAHALACYRTDAGPLSAAEAITDLVADIGHFCLENDLAYQYLLAQGVGHWRLEMTDPESVETLPEVTITINESNPCEHL